MTIQLHHGDCLEVMAAMEPDSVDSIVTDPPAGVSFMGKTWDTDHGGRDAWIANMTTIAAQCYRVLKPGGHALVWALPRTSHWTATAWENAGFEVRDRVAHVFGSGFPKSHDVSKAIDRAADAERDVVGNNPNHRGESQMRNPFTKSLGQNGSITAPATPDAERWVGWGTALKPAMEDWWLLRKPLVEPGIDIMQAIVYNLRKNGFLGDIQWTQRPASHVAKPSQLTSSTPTRQLALPEGISAAPASESVTLGTENAIEKVCDKPDGIGSPQTKNVQGSNGVRQTGSCEMMLLQRMEGSAPVAEKAPTNSSPLTTSMETEDSTEKKQDATFTATYAGTGSRLVIGSCVGIATVQSEDTATVLTATFDGVEYQVKRTPDGLFVWPEGLPRTVAPKQLTVAANVLAWGTGAINVDGCRVGTDQTVTQAKQGMYGAGSAEKMREYGFRPYHIDNRDQPEKINPPGRWPANLVHDGSDEVLGLFPDGGGGGSRNGKNEPSWNGTGFRDQSFVAYNDTGSAARFFYCAKASRADRDEGLEGMPKRGRNEVYGNGLNTATKCDPAMGHTPDSVEARPQVRNHHPTVKPTDLMRYLCRLVTPPGGIVLDPFMGSGSTGKGAVLEGFSFVGIEQDAEYIEIARRRIDAARLPLFAEVGE